MVDHKKIAKAASVVGGATLLSRIFGFVRDMVVAKLFGAGLATDAFFVAFRIPNLLRRLVGEGALTASFIPVYSEYINQKSKEEGDELVSAVFSVLTVALVILTGLGILFSPWIIKVMAYGFSQDPEKFKLTVLLTRIMFPYIFFIGLVALAMGVLNSWKHFTAPALAPVLLNISIIACALLFHEIMKEPVLSLAFGVLLGGLAQLFFQVPFIRRKKIAVQFIFRLAHPGVRRIGLLMAPSVLGLGVTQLNVLISTFLASYLPEGSVSYLYFADRLLEFPMGIFAIAIATAVLPALSEQTARNDIQGMKETFSFSLRLVFFVTLPAMVGLIVLRVPIINLLFQRGAFSVHSAEMTAQALLYYALGLAAFAGVRIVVPAFYSLKDTKTPVKVAFLALLANAGFGAVLMFPLKHGGLALATSLAAGLNFTLLVILLRKKLGRMGGRKILRSFLQSLGASLAMGVAAYAVCSGGPWQTDGATPEKIILLLGAMLTGTLVYGGVSYALKSEEMYAALEIIKKKIGAQREG
ncbi:MAG: murein biosynthesis integral membrane protein MurJ [Thermodesulfobacteriota bacterium]|nr:murein biosynthesis integral membrane protein MurJ [Thermodesulfobacteriota bacterium]